MMRALGRMAQAIVLLCTITVLMGFSPPKPPIDIVVGVQATGTAQWEMQVIKERKLDEKYGVNLILKDVADSRAGQVALQAGEVDIILSDFVWTAIQRAQGNMVTIVPHSLAVGGVMVAPDSGITSVDDLVGKTVGIAGGPVDKSWIVLQAYYAQNHSDRLADQITARFGAPPLINELLTSGEIDASLNFWHFNARMKAAGMTELKSVASMMADMGATTQPPLLGWVFTDETAADKHDAVMGFLEASFAAKHLLLTSDSIWEKLKDRMRAADDPVLFKALQQDYRAGIIQHYTDDTVKAAADSFALMAEFGGADLVGDTTSLPDGTFWDGFRN